MLLNGPKAIDAMNETNDDINITCFSEKSIPTVKAVK